MSIQTTVKPTKRINYKNWLLALWTVPEFQEGEWVDPVTKWLMVTRASVLSMTVISGLLGGLLAAVAGKFDLGLTLLTTLGITLAHAGSNLVNDYWDARHGWDDLPDSPRANYGPQGFVHGDFSRRTLITAIVIILALASLIGLYLTLVAGWPVALFAVAGAAVLLLYSGDPFPLKYRGLGEIAVLIVWGPLMVGGTYYILARELPLWVIIASLPYALGVMTVLLGKHLDKYDFDRTHGIRTLVVIIGEKNARKLTQWCMVLMYVSALALLVMGFWMPKSMTVFGLFMPSVVLVLLAIPSLRQIWPIFNLPKPKEKPAYDPIWPLYFVGLAFVHNRNFGGLYLVGILLDIALRAFVFKA
ncbi:MAG: prenyltransferase [Anaerolineae bacterium]